MTRNVIRLYIIAIIAFIAIGSLSFYFFYFCPSQKIESPKECIIKIPETISLQAVDSDNSTVIENGYKKIIVPEKLCFSSPPSKETYYVIQFVDVILPEHKARVESLDADLLGYISNNGWLVKMNLYTKERVESLEFIQWVGMYHPFYKIAPWGLSSLEESENVELIVRLFDGENVSKISKRIKFLGGSILYTSESSRPPKLKIKIKASKILEIANINGVMGIEKFVAPGIFPPAPPL